MLGYKVAVDTISVQILDYEKDKVSLLRKLIEEKDLKEGVFRIEDMT
jgi:hypothetical protein